MISEYYAIVYMYLFLQWKNKSSDISSKLTNYQYNDNDNEWQWKSFFAKVVQGETCDQYNTYRIVCLKGEQDE